MLLCTCVFVYVCLFACHSVMCAIARLFLACIIQCDCVSSFRGFVLAALLVGACTYGEVPGAMLNVRMSVRLVLLCYAGHCAARMCGHLQVLHC